MAAVKTAPPQPIPRKNWRAQDWIDHALFAVGQISESRGDKLDIDFVNGRRKTLLKSTELNRAVAPDAGFKFPRDKGKLRASQLKVKGLLKRSVNERKPVSRAREQVGVRALCDEADRGRAAR
jgi:hypothetical protein